MNTVFNKVKATIAAASALAFSAAPAFAQIKNPLGQFATPSDFFSAIVNGLVTIAGTIALVYLVIGGIRYIMSGGDKVAVEGAREQITSAITGLVIVFGAWFIITIIGQLLGLETILTPKK